MCDAERHEMHSHQSVRNDDIRENTYRAHAPRGYAVLDALRPLLAPQKRRIHVQTKTPGAISRSICTVQ